MPSATTSLEQRRLLRIVMVTAAAVMLGTSIVIAATAGDGADPQRLVYVSGRDDHGALATDTVAVHAGPDGAEVGALADGTVARVEDSRGTWLRIEPVDGSTGGWVDDYWLRGRVHLVDPAAPGCAVTTAATAGGPPRYQLPASVQVEVFDARTVDGRAWVAVRAGEDHDLSWVPQAMLSDIPGPNPLTASAGCQDLDWPEPAHDH
ncbi:MAG TPA: hypothetical protein VK906_11505 [Egicoccus sp.]|nr:hypothetical protein [Egicoccus sp.]HSK23798.1 hypothetical protein [Egicoccus sp.]